MVVCTASAMAFEHEPAEGFSFMGLFGMNVSNLQSHPYNAKVGATLGFRADYMLPKAHGTYVTAGLDWTMKGGKKTTTETLATATPQGIDCDYTRKYALHYLEIPVRLGFRYNPREDWGLYTEIGPYFAVGVGGCHKLSIDADGNDARNVESSETFGAFRKRIDIARQTFQRWDAGVSFRVGAEYNGHYNLLMGFDWGLADIYRNSLRDAYWENMIQKTGAGERLPKVNNFNFSLTVGYRF